MRVVLACEDSDVKGFLEGLPGVEVLPVESREEILPAVEDYRPDVLIISDTLPGKVDLLELLQAVSESGVRVILQADRFADDQVTLRCACNCGCSILTRNFNFAELERMLWDGCDNARSSPAPINTAPDRVKKQWPPVKKSPRQKFRREKPVKERQLPNLVVVYSPVSAGKTFTAVNLAARAAQTGHSVALVDVDVLQPSVGLWLDIPAGREFLSHALNDPYHPGFRPKMPAELTVYAPAPEQPPVIDRGRLAFLFEALCEKNDLVIVDTPRDMDSYNLTYLLSAASRIVLVADLDYSRLILLHRKLKSLGRVLDSGKLVLVANRVVENKKVSVADIERAAMITCRCIVPDIPAPVLEGIYAGKPPALYVPELKAMDTLLGGDDACSQRKQEIS